MKFHLILRRALVSLVLLAVAPAAFSQMSFAAGLGVNFFRYETPYLTALAATYLYEYTDGVELNIGGEFAINTTEDDDGDVVPRFLLPANIGLNFVFPRDQVSVVFGTGLTPVFVIDEDGDTSFLMGPYAKGAVRVNVHPFMSWFLEIQQDLLIGGSDWINTGTRASSGIVFSFENR
ncbi:MAG: hypothetical protein EA428_10155 [Spirochaetaceae bacterium]|nr:MAG: hypothetical protein EA428_10155 [Spirochaetaceae bacterium]